MNIKLKNLRSAEEDLGKFLGNIVVTSELATSICGDEVNDAYLEYVIQLNSKVKRAPDTGFIYTVNTQTTDHIALEGLVSAHSSINIDGHQNHCHQ